MIKAVVFDVDDTLYDLSTPFKEACREVFPEDTDLDLEGAFLASRRYSDSVYAVHSAERYRWKRCIFIGLKMHFVIMERK